MATEFQERPITDEKLRMAIDELYGPPRQSILSAVQLSSDPLQSVRALMDEVGFDPARLRKSLEQFTVEETEIFSSYLESLNDLFSTPFAIPAEDLPFEP